MNGFNVLKSAVGPMSVASDEVKALKLFTLLEGEALAVWLELSEEEQNNLARENEKWLRK